MKKLFLILSAAVVLAPLFGEPNYTFSSERRDEAFPSGFMIERTFVIIEHKGKKWELSLPVADWEAKNFSLGNPAFAETDEGFYIAFVWGGGRYFWRETFFFKESGGEPCLYKIESTCDELSWDENGEPNGETDTETRSVTPPIKISELSAEKINKLLGRGDREQ